MRRVERFIEIDAPVERVFDLFGDFESFPRWMRGLREVRRTGRRTTYWVGRTAMRGLDVEWEAETTVFEPDRRIAWRSLRGDVRTDGEAVFAGTPEGGTFLRLVVGYATPGGRSGADAARFFGKHPARQLEEDLYNFKRFAEREGARRRTTNRELSSHAGRALPPPPRRASGALARRDEDEHSARRSDEGRRGRRFERDRHFEDGRPAEDRLPVGAGRAAEDVRGGRRRPEERGRREGAREAGDYEPRRDGGREDEYRPRYALTPREREREHGSGRGRFDEGVAETFRRRGVERLLDEEPRGGRRRTRRGGD